MGTSPSDIAARLNIRYPNLSASSPRGITFRPKEPKAVHTSTEMRNTSEDDLNNNLATRVDMNLAANQLQELKCDLPVETIGRKQCICMRPPIAYECGRCHQLFHGRTAEICDKHPSVSMSLRPLYSSELLKFLLCFIGIISDGLPAVPLLRSTHQSDQAVESQLGANLQV